MEMMSTFNPFGSGNGNVYDNLEAGTNILIEKTADGKAKISASGEISSEDTVARANIAAIKNGETLDSFGDVEIALDDKADKSTTYTKTEVNTALDAKQNTISDLSAIRSGAALGATAVQPEAGKGLSTNNYTNAEKTKLAGIADGAEVNEIEGIKVNNTTINPDTNKIVNITIPTTAADVSALPNTTRYAAALSITIDNSFIMLCQLKDQNGNNLGTTQRIDLPIESVVVGGSYDSLTQKIVLTLYNGDTIKFSIADLVSDLQAELSESNKLNPAYINYNSTHRAVSDAEKSAWNGKQNALTTTQLAAVNSGINSSAVEQIETNKNDISYFAPVIKTKYMTIETDYTLISDCTMTIPAKTIARVSATLAYNSSDPTGILITTSSNNPTSAGSIIAKAESEGGQLGLSVSGVKPNYNATNMHIYVWAKSKSSAQNRVYSVLEKLGDSQT